MPVFREFMYLDEKLVNELLAQVEDGIYDEDERTSSSGSDRTRGIDARLDVAPISASANSRTGATGAEQRKRVVRQTPESRFNRLYSALSDDLIRIDGETPSIWPSIEVRKLIEIDGYVDVPTIGRALASADQLSGLMEVMRMFAPDQVTPEAEETVNGVKAMHSMMAGSVLANIELDESDPSFVAKLEEQWLKVSIGELEGEASVLGRVKRRWTEGQSYPLLAVPGLDVMSRKDRRAAERRGAATEQSDLMVEGPAATLSVVAIYR